VLVWSISGGADDDPDRMSPGCSSFLALLLEGTRQSFFLNIFSLPSALKETLGKVFLKKLFSLPIALWKTLGKDFF
jgi:hypothetical protein